MHVVVDSSVFIDWLNHVPSLQVELLKSWAYRRSLLVGDLVLVEVLQGASSERDAARIETLLSEFPSLQIADRHCATEAARNYRALRAKGITIRKTIDTLIATRCITDGLPLLFSDRDFQPFVDHLGLRDAISESVAP